MKLHVLAACLAASVPLAGAAGDGDPADPASPVPRMAYRSVFEGVAAGVEEEVLPWKQVNDTVAQFPRGHADLLKWEASPSPAPAVPAPATQPAPPAAPAGGRHVH